MRYDLEERTLAFSKAVRNFLSKIPQHPLNLRDIDQCVRSSGSVGAHYLEANDCLGKKDFVMHIKIWRKEAKETYYWLKLIDAGSYKDEQIKLAKEANELMLIFGAILQKCISKIG